jgi:hypothetical protein
VKVLGLSADEDCAGVGVGLVKAFRGTDIEFRFVRRAQNYIHYETDIEWLPGDDATGREVERLYRAADIVHVMQWPRVIDPAWPRKPTLYHHHGTVFRNHAAAYVDLARRGDRYVVSTLDLWLYGPDCLTWLPNVTDLAALPKRVPHEGLRIAHAPTARGTKSTEAFLAACRRLGRETAITVDLIEGVTHAECLRRKAAADIYYDQVLVGYGVNAIEAWGMGIPVVAGASKSQSAAHGIAIPDGVLDEMRRRFGCLPFVLADETTIYDALRSLVDPDARQKAAERGLAHVRRFHSPEAVVAALRPIYEGLLR